MQRYWPVILLLVVALGLTIAGVMLLQQRPQTIEPDASGQEVAQTAPTLSVNVDTTQAAESSQTTVATAANVLSVDPIASALPTETATPEVSPTPEASPTPEPSPTPLWPMQINGVDIGAIVPMSPEIAENVLAIWARGQELGRDPNTFSKLGDSTILNPHFLGPFDEGNYNLGEFANLQPTIDQFTGSFDRHGVGARFGMHSWTVFDPQWADKDWCLPNEDSLACEFRLNNPSVLFVRLGSNDAGAPSGFRYNLQQVIDASIENGVIPIIGTKADRFEGSNENNDILRELAAENNVPLWDFDLLAGTIPGRGLDTDNVHLKIDDLPHDYTLEETFQRGHPLQDLVALLALDQIRRMTQP